MTALLANWLFAFGLFFAVFVPLERLFAAHRQRILRPEWFTDLLFFSGQYLLWTGLSVYALAALDAAMRPWLLWGLRELVAAQPLWLQALAAIFLCDLCIYWGHRLSHKYDCLWRFHRVHHTAEHLDWLAAFREHPLDNVYTRVIENFPALLLGIDLRLLAGFVVFRGIWGMFIHSNCNLSVGPLKYLLGSPKLHHWHHDLGKGGRVNYANLMPVMDLIFGTYHEPKTMPPSYGTTDDVPHGYAQQLIEPFRRRPPS